ncbi:dndB_like domain containing protein [Candidatus Nanopelagicaceae bacterium]
MTDFKLGGYSVTKELAAQQVTRGGKTVYILSLPIQLVPVHLPIPDPSRPIDSNRAVSKSHAEGFGAYWLKNVGSWTVPPLLVDTADHLKFDEKFSITDGPRLGVLHLPDYSNQILRTLDGQHRILGWSIVRNRLIKDLEAAQEQFQIAQRTGTSIEKDLASEKLEQTRASLQRMQTEQVTLEIVSGVTEHEHKTFFITIADNAVGINTSERARMDETNMTARVAKQLTDNLEILQNRIEMRKSSAGKSSKDLMSLANVRDIVRHACFGIKGKVTAAREQSVNDSNAIEISEHFFRAMNEAIPHLQQISNGIYLPKALKQESLLGSVTIWRCLAGSYNDLAVKLVNNKELHWDKNGHDKFVEMLKELFKKMKISGTGSNRKIQSTWAETGCFNPGELAPRSRAQDLRNLSALFTAWAESGTAFNPKKINK